MRKTETRKKLEGTKASVTENFKEHKFSNVWTPKRKDFVLGYSE